MSKMCVSNKDLEFGFLFLCLLQWGPFVFSYKGTPPLKKMFSFGHCPNEGGGGNCPNLKIHFIYSFMTAEKDVQVARKKGRGGGRGNSGNARKKTFFFT